MEAVKSIDLEWDIIKAPLGVGGPLLIYLFFHPCNVFIACFAKKEKRKRKKKCEVRKGIWIYISGWTDQVISSEESWICCWVTSHCELNTWQWFGMELKTLFAFDEINLHIYKMLQVALLNVLLLFYIFSLTNVYLPSCISMLHPFFLYLPVIYNS